MKRLAVLLFLLVLSGCIETKKDDEVTFLIKTTRKTNRGTPLYVILQETTMAQFLAQDYKTIAAQSFWKEVDNPNIVKKVLVPNTTHTIKMPLPGKDKSIGVYFLFTEPGGSWKYILNKSEADKVKILLGETEYQSVNVFE